MFIVQLVKMSTEELASKDLAEWREQEVKRQLNLIEKNEQERLSQVNKYLIKTHKGEEFIKEVDEDYDELDDDTSKIAGFPDTPPEDSNLKHMFPKSKRDLNSIQALEGKDEKSTTRSHSSTKNDGEKRTRSSGRSSRYSESKSRRYDYHRSSRQSEKKDRERRDEHSSSSSKSRSKYRHHSRKSDRYKEQGKNIEAPESNAISQSAEPEADGFTGFNDGEELNNSNQRFSPDVEVPISSL